MLDYYFCEQCQTYHQPNRLINGQILSACQCEISTQPSMDELPAEGPSRKGKIIETVSYQTAGTGVRGRQPELQVRYQSPRMSTQVREVRAMQGPGVKIQNMPFISIINEDNQHSMRRLVKPQTQPRPNQPQIFMSPRRVRQDVPIPVKKSISPVMRPQQKIVTPSYPVFKTQPVLPTPRQMARIVPIQQSRPTRIMIKTPIQTIANIAYPQTLPQITQTFVQNVVERPSMPIIEQPYIPPSIKIISEENEQITDRFANRISLDRVSGVPYADRQEDEERERRGKRISLDRVTEGPNVHYEGQEQGNCCGQFCD